MGAGSVVIAGTAVVKRRGWEEREGVQAHVMEAEEWMEWASLQLTDCAVEGDLTDQHWS